MLRTGFLGQRVRSILDDAWVVVNDDEVVGLLFEEGGSGEDGCGWPKSNVLG
jgi:hypothetical protein